MKPLTLGAGHLWVQLFVTARIIASLDFISAVQDMIHFIYHFVHYYSRVSHDVTTAMLVPLNKEVLRKHADKRYISVIIIIKETAAMLVPRPNHPGIELYYYANASFCFRWKTCLTIRCFSHFGFFSTLTLYQFVLAQTSTSVLYWFKWKSYDLNFWVRKYRYTYRLNLQSFSNRSRVWV